MTGGQINNEKIMMLDEVGAIELMWDSFTKELYQLLNGVKSCMGVLKLKTDGLRLGKKLTLGRNDEDWVEAFHRSIKIS